MWDYGARDGVGAGSLEPCELTRDAGDEDAHVEEGNHNPRHAGNEEPAPRQGSGRRAAGTHPPDPSTLFPCPFGHNTTLQHYRLPSVTTTVTSWGAART